jgi:hypothetical protein
MKKVTREEILDYVTYEEQRDAIRDNAIKVKEQRRVHLGDHLTFLFENHDTVRYQVLEMVRTERLVKESEILHELKTYNELIGQEKGQIFCTLLIEIDNPETRTEKLMEWLPLPNHIYLKLDNGEKVYAEFDSRQVGEKRLSSVQFMSFSCGDHYPVAIGCDLEALTLENELSDIQLEALRTDLVS